MVKYCKLNTKEIYGEKVRLRTYRQYAYVLAASTPTYLPPVRLRTCCQYAYDCSGNTPTIVPTIRLRLFRQYACGCSDPSFAEGQAPLFPLQEELLFFGQWGCGMAICTNTVIPGYGTNSPLERGKEGFSELRHGAGNYATA